MQKALVLFAAMLAVTVAQTANLTGLGSSATVYAVLVHGSDVFVGGSFSSFSNLAKFNTQTGNFTLVANGSLSTVKALAIRGNELFVGGSGTVLTSGDYGFNRVNLTTNTWAPVPAGYPAGSVYGLAVLGNDVVIASSSTPRIVHFINETYFNPAFDNNTGLFNDYARAVRNINGTLYAVGDFTTPCSRVVRWNATIGNWTCVSSATLDSYAFAIAGDAAGNLFVGGQFSEYLVMLNQTNGGWSEISSTVFDDDVYALHLTGGALYVGGDFTNYFAKLSLTTGLSNVTAVNSYVYGFDSDANYLYVGGNFYYGMQRVSFGGAVPTPASTVTGTSTENSATSVSVSVAFLIMVLIALLF